MSVDPRSPVPTPLPGTSGPGIVPHHVPPDLVRNPTFDDPNTLDDPFSVTANIFADMPPVFFWPRPRPGRYDGTWVVTHYDDIRDVYQKDDLYSTEGAASVQTLVGETFKMLPLAVDPPEHSAYRILLNPWFSPRAVKALEPQMLAVVNDLIDGFVDKGECDVAHDFSRIYPVRVFLNLMGFPQEKLEDFLTWEHAITHSFRNVEIMKSGVSSALAYLRGFIEEVRLKPDDKLASYIVHGQVDGRPITEDEIIGCIFFLWIGGLDTVAATSSLMFRRLALQPELQAQLRDNPHLIPDAIEEFLRVQPLVNSSRIVKQDHVIRDVQIRAGDHVTCFNIAGNFDPEEFQDPREVRFDRTPNRHFTFAAGPHRCLGSHVARREMALALGEFLRRIPSFSLKPGSDRTVYPGLIAAPRLDLVWEI